MLERVEGKPAMTPWTREPQIRVRACALVQDLPSYSLNYALVYAIQICLSF